MQPDDAVRLARAELAAYDGDAAMASEKLENHRARGPELREVAARREQAVSDARARLDAEERLKQIDGEVAWRTMEKRAEDLETRRTQLDALLRQKIANPALELSAAGHEVLAAVKALLDSAPPLL